MPLVPRKRCSRCKLDKRLLADYYPSQRKSGYCIPCTDEYNREKRILRQGGTPYLRFYATDPDWKAKHDSKVCIACRKSGPEISFQDLRRKRCDQCVKAGLKRCARCMRLMSVRKFPSAKRKTRCKECINTIARLRRIRDREILLSKSVSPLRGRTCARCGVQLKADHNGYAITEHVCHPE